MFPVSKDYFSCLINVLMRSQKPLTVLYNCIQVNEKKLMILCPNYVITMYFDALNPIPRIAPELQYF